MEGQRITVIDFDDVHHMWFACDIATLLFYSRWLGGRDADMAAFTRFFFTNFWKGYNSENHLDSWWKETYHDFLKLREMVTYVWLNKKWDMANLEARQQDTLDRFRHNIANDVPLINTDFTRI